MKGARSLLALAFLVLSCAHTRSAVISWIGGSGDWNTATNWSAGALPGPDDDVVIAFIRSNFHSHTEEEALRKNDWDETDIAFRVSDAITHPER